MPYAGVSKGPLFVHHEGRTSVLTTVYSPHAASTMTTPEDRGAATNNLRFKRRKTTHTKRARINDEGPATNNNEALDATSVQNAPEPVQDEEDSVPNLKEILRNRKRPRDRPKDATRRPEVSHMDPEHGQVDAPKQDRYTSRFVAQTGQVVDSSDAQM